MQVSLVLVIDIKFLSEFGALAVWFVLVIMILVRMADYFDPESSWGKSSIFYRVHGAGGHWL